MNRETIIRCTVALIVAVFDFLKMFGIDFGIDSDAIYGLVTVVVGIWIAWKNNDFTPEAREATAIMRIKKKCKKANYTGEDFSDV